MPPSIITVIWDPTALTISSRASIVAGTVSNWRAPWFETTIPLQPVFSASLASSCVIIPFRMTGNVVNLQPSDKHHKNHTNHFFLITQKQTRFLKSHKKQLINNNVIDKVATYFTSHSTSLQLSDGSNCLLTYSLIPEPPELCRWSRSSVKLANL